MSKKWHRYFRGLVIGNLLTLILPLLSILVFVVFSSINSHNAEQAFYSFLLAGAAFNVWLIITIVLAILNTFSFRAYIYFQKPHGKQRLWSTLAMIISALYALAGIFVIGSILFVKQ
jgi:hypothetical protein